MKRTIVFTVLLLVAGAMAAQGRSCIFSEVGTRIGYNYYSKPGKNWRAHQYCW